MTRRGVMAGQVKPQARSTASFVARTQVQRVAQARGLAAQQVAVGTHRVIRILVAAAAVVGIQLPDVAVIASARVRAAPWRRRASNLEDPSTPLCVAPRALSLPIAMNIGHRTRPMVWRARFVAPVSRTLA